MHGVDEEPGWHVVVGVATAAEAVPFPSLPLIDPTRFFAGRQSGGIMNAAVSRIAESLGDEVVQVLRSLRQQGVPDDLAAAEIQRGLDVDQFERLLGYFLRRHLREAATQA